MLLKIMLILTGVPEFIKTIMKMDMTNFNPENTYEEVLIKYYIDPAKEKQRVWIHLKKNQRIQYQLDKYERYEDMAMEY